MNAPSTAVVPSIRQGHLDESSLAGEVVIVTGAGGGIGLEAARCLLFLGASVVVAEIDAKLCSAATRQLGGEAGPDRLMCLQADVADERSVHEMVTAAAERFGKIDVVVNNATFAPAGASVVESTVDSWDRSYAVNLRGPMLLARECLPGMIARKHGVFVCVSSTGGPFLAPYETLKSAQLALANSLDAELEETGVIAFTIGPGLVPTPTAVAAIERIAPRLGMTVEEFWRTNGGAVLSVEAAGAGFAAAIAMADRYRGQEISSTQALIDAGIKPPVAFAATSSRTDLDAIDTACTAVLGTLEEQATGWKGRSFFERQWILRDFKQRVGIPVERGIEMLEGLHSSVSSGNVGSYDRGTLNRLAGFYKHLGELASGYVNDPTERARQVATTDSWVADVGRLLDKLPPQAHA